MYKTILVTLEATPTDRAIIEHIKQLAQQMHSRVVLLHVATGVPAQVHGPDAAGHEIDEDRAYLTKVQGEFEAAGVKAETELVFGDPVTEICRWVDERGCDLVAMSTHGHGWWPICFSARPPVACSTTSASRCCCYGCADGSNCRVRVAAASERFCRFPSAASLR